jgi:hypothetical protein
MVEPGLELAVLSLPAQFTKSAAGRERVREHQNGGWYKGKPLENIFF